MTIPNRYIGSSLDDFLQEEGTLEEAHLIAVTEARAWQADQASNHEKVTELSVSQEPPDGTLSGGS